MKYPNCELLAKHEVEIAHIERFIRWLSLNGYAIVDMDEEQAGDGIAWQSVGIDLREIEQERKALLSQALGYVSWHQRCVTVAQRKARGDL